MTHNNEHRKNKERFDAALLSEDAALVRQAMEKLKVVSVRTYLIESAKRILNNVPRGTVDPNESN